MSISDKTNLSESSSHGDQQNSLGNVYHELNQLRQSGGLNSSNLTDVNEQLHQQGILPRIDFTDTSNGDLAIRGRSGDPGPDGTTNLVNSANGRDYTYDQQGHVQSVSLDSGKDVWSYDNKTGTYDQTVDGKATGKSTHDAIYTLGNGDEVDARTDGSQRVINGDGEKYYDPNGGLAREVGKDGEVKDFQYQNGQLSSVTEYKSVEDEQNHNASQTYNRNTDGNFYAANDTNHSNPMNIEIGDNAQTAGAVLFKNADGSTDVQRLSGVDIQRNAQGELTSEKYVNGNQANDFQYDANGKLIGFDMNQTDGTKHTYTAEGDQITVDGGTDHSQTFNGSLNYDKYSQLQVTNTDTGASTDFRYSGAQLTRDSDLNPTQVVDAQGNVNTYQWSGDQLTGVNANGHQLQMNEQGQWLNADGTPANVTPQVDQVGQLSLTNNNDGQFTRYLNNDQTIDGSTTPSADPNAQTSNQNWAEQARWRNVYEMGGATQAA